MLNHLTRTFTISSPLPETDCEILVTKTFCQFTAVSGHFSYAPAKQKLPESYEYLSDCVKVTGITLLSDSQ